MEDDLDENEIDTRAREMARRVMNAPPLKPNVKAEPKPVRERASKPKKIAPTGEAS